MQSERRGTAETESSKDLKTNESLQSAVITFTGLIPFCLSCILVGPIWTWRFLGGIEGLGHWIVWANFVRKWSVFYGQKKLLVTSHQCQRSFAPQVISAGNRKYREGHEHGFDGQAAWLLLGRFSFFVAGRITWCHLRHKNSKATVSCEHVRTLSGGWVGPCSESVDGETAGSTGYRIGRHGSEVWRKHLITVVNISARIIKERPSWKTTGGLRRTKWLADSRQWLAD